MKITGKKVVLSEVQLNIVLEEGQARDFKNWIYARLNLSRNLLSDSELRGESVAGEINNYIKKLLDN